MPADSHPRYYCGDCTPDLPVNAAYLVHAVPVDGSMIAFRSREDARTFREAVKARGVTSYCTVIEVVSADDTARLAALYDVAADA